MAGRSSHQRFAGELVAELSSIHPIDNPQMETLESLLGSQLNDVLSGGLSVLSDAVLRSLIRHPWLLLDLQEKIFVDGGFHWSNRKPTAEEAEQLERVWSKVSAVIASKPKIQNLVGDRPKQKTWNWLAPLALVVSTILCAWFLRGQLGNAPNPVVNADLQASCGWTRPGALKQDLSRDEYLKSLIDGAGDWFKVTPRNSSELAASIKQFQQGCSIVLASEHRPLPEADKKWLIEKCQAWSKKLGGHLADLNMGGDFETVKKAADETINTLIEKLRERAAGINA